MDFVEEIVAAAVALFASEKWANRCLLGLAIVLVVAASYSAYRFLS